MGKTISGKLIAIIAAGIGAVAIVAGVLIWQFAGKNDTYRSIQIYELSGATTITREGIGQMEAVENLYLESGDRLVVGQDSSARLKLDDDKFEVILISAKTKPELVRIASMILTSKVKNMPGVEYYKTNNFRVTFDKIPPSWVIDGEEYEHNTKTFEFNINKEISMLLPKKNIVKLFSTLEEEQD